MVAPTLPKLTASQRAVVLSYTEAFVAYLQEHNLNVVDRHAGTTTWMQNTASEIMKHADFDREKLGGRKPAEVQKVCLP